MLTAVSSLQAAVGQKLDRAESDAALARKLDVRTFLASQSSVPNTLEGLSLASGGAAAPAAAQGSLYGTPHSHVSPGAARQGTGAMNTSAIEQQYSAQNDAYALATPNSVRSAAQAASPQPSATCRDPSGSNAVWRARGAGTPPLTIPGGAGVGAVNCAGAHAAGGIHRQNITPAIGLVRPTLKAAEDGRGTFMDAAKDTGGQSAGTGDFNFTENAGRPHASSSTARPPLAQPPGGMLSSDVSGGSNIFSEVHTHGPSCGAGVGGSSSGVAAGALQPLQLAEKWRERPGTPSSGQHGISSYQGTPLSSQVCIYVSMRFR